MLELKAVANHLGLSEHQARRVLRALTPVLQAGIKRGRDNRILVENGDLAIMERAVALWHGGLPLRDLSQTVASELGNGNYHGSVSLVPNLAKPPSDHCPTCEAREELVRELRADKTRLIEELSEARQQIRALAPGQLANGNGGPSSRPSLTRWRALRYIVLGR